MRIPFRRKKTVDQPPPEAPESPASAPATPPPGKEPGPGETPTNIDGLRAWVAQIDRKLGARFYALAAASVLGLAAGIVAIVLVLGVKDDSATKDELGQLRGEIAGVEQSTTQAVEEDFSALSDRVDQLESQVQGMRSDQGTTEQEISVLQDDISDLRDDISDLRSDADADAASDTDPP